MRSVRVPLSRLGSEHGRPTADTRMELHPVPRMPRGFTCAGVHSGLKADGEDLSLFVSSTPAAAAAVFTRNHFAGAPVVVGRELVRDGRLQAVVANSRYSNAGTGREGEADARAMGAAAAAELGLTADLVLMSSTGLIGRRLPVDRIVEALPTAVASLSRDPLAAARGIMTTDTHPKVISVSVGEAVLTVVAKGAGMISPDMATLLVFAFTDAAIEPGPLRTHLATAVRDTFQMLSIDTDTSTSDTCVLLANGRAGPVDEVEFVTVLHGAFERMTEIVARDGEGASKLLRVRVDGAASDRDARRVARALVESPLIKTMAYGADPNVGRILMAVGKCVGCTVAPDRLEASIADLLLIAEGVPTAFDEPAARELLRADPVELRVDLRVGRHGATAWGCDLTEGYVTENAAYASS